MSLTAEFSVQELTEMMSRFSSIEEMLKFVTEHKQLQDEVARLKEQNAQLAKMHADVLANSG